MIESTEKFPVQRISEGEPAQAEVAVAREIPFTIMLNEQELVTMLCSPGELQYLAAGFLASEGFISSRENIVQLNIDEERGVARVTTRGSHVLERERSFKRIIASGCGRGASFYSAADLDNVHVESAMKVSAEAVHSLVNRFQHGSDLYRATHAVHSAALCDTESILVFSEDIGRHNAIDKVFGRCLLEDMPTGDRLVLTTGRITSEILYKVARREVAIMVSISAPTNLGITIAETLGITMVASVRGKRMNVYTGAERILT